MNIVITGCTGVGKTTIAKLLSKKINATFIEEPIFENDFLSDSYNKPELYGTLSQISFMLSFSKLQDNWHTCKSDFLIQERCVSDCLFVFSRRLLMSNQISLKEYKLLEKLHSYFIQNTNPIDLFIYLKAPNEITLQRIKQRDRGFESNLNMNFLNSQEELYNQWFENLSNVYIVNNISIEDAVNEIENYILNNINLKVLK